MDFTLVLEVKEWAREQAELLVDHQWNDDTERALMVDKQHAQNWTEAEQLQLWEFDEGDLP